MKNFLRRMEAFLWILLGFFLIVASLSYHSSDPSFNTAGGHVQNLAGEWGAVTADFLWQGIGLMTFSVMFFPIFFGLLKWREKKWLKTRFVVFLLSLPFGCWLIAQFPFENPTVLPAGRAGFLGFYLTQWGICSEVWCFYVLAALLVGFLLFAFDISFFSLLPKLGKGVFRVFQKLFQRIRLPEVRLPQMPALKKTQKKVSISKKSSPRAKQTVQPEVKKAKTNFVLPGSELLSPVKSSSSPSVSKEAMLRTSADLEAVLAQFGVNGKVVHANPGPVVTLYEFEPASGVRTSRVITLADDIAREMRAISVRIALIPGSNTIGIEMPNAKREIVYIREMVENIKFQGNNGVLPLILGKDIAGAPVYADLAKMPHLLVAGTTGSGKSVAINTMILSLLYRFTPAECRLIMVDPKMLELSVYNGIPHLLTPVVTDVGKAVVALKWAVREMEDRYRAMSQLNVRNIDGYNQKLLQAQREGKVLTRRVQTGFDEAGVPIMEEQALDLTVLPYIVVVVDEMADLMIQAGKDVEGVIQRLAQMARAAGIHLILATQRPSVDVITGTIKSNFPTRMSFQVTSKIDSRTILGESGAEQLLGKGDMLFMPAGQRPNRIHGPFVSDEDVERVVQHVRSQGEVHYLDAVLADSETGSDLNREGFSGASSGGSGDSLYDQAVAIVLRDQKTSISYVQRQLRIGYNKAADLIDRMEDEGVLSKPNVAGKREILVPTDNA